MKSHRNICFAQLLGAGTLAFAATRALAQASPPLALPELPNSAASAPRSTAPTGPRLRSAAETGNRAAGPGDLRPDRPVTPQVLIPFGKKAPPPTKGEERVVERGNTTSSGGVDEAAARCESQMDNRVRATCRAKLAGEATGRLPN